METLRSILQPSMTILFIAGLSLMITGVILLLCKRQRQEKIKTNLVFIHFLRLLMRDMGADKNLHGRLHGGICYYVSKSFGRTNSETKNLFRTFLSENKPEETPNSIYWFNEHPTSPEGFKIRILFLRSLILKLEIENRRLRNKIL